MDFNDGLLLSAGMSKEQVKKIKKYLFKKMKKHDIDHRTVPVKLGNKVVLLCKTAVDALELYGSNYQIGRIVD